MKTDLLSLPDDDASNTKDYPLLIYLHGISGRGSDLKIGAGPGGEHWTEKFIMVAPPMSRRPDLVASAAHG